MKLLLVLVFCISLVFTQPGRVLQLFYIDVRRSTFEDEHHASLGQLVKISKQIVSGVNYKMVFESQNGPYEITVYCQPWTGTYKVLSSAPYISD